MDNAAVNELLIYIRNDSRLINQLESVYKNSSIKLKKGVYDENLAPKAYRHLVNRGAKLYATEFCSLGQWNIIFTVETRREVEKQLANYFLIEYRLGNMEYLFR
jgi:hypothetical protein